MSSVFRVQQRAIDGGEVLRHDGMLRPAKRGSRCIQGRHISGCSEWQSCIQLHLHVCAADNLRGFGGPAGGDDPKGSQKLEKNRRTRSGMPPPTDEQLDDEEEQEEETAPNRGVCWDPARQRSRGNSGAAGARDPVPRSSRRSRE